MAEKNPKLRMAPPPFPWFGGKARLRKQIVPLLPDHKVCVEPFAGAASVFFGKPKSGLEVLNDINVELVRFYRVLQHHPGALLDEMAELHFGREEFRRLRDADLASLTDVQRAARFLYLQRASYAALPGRPHFAPLGNKAYNLIRRSYELRSRKRTSGYATPSSKTCRGRKPSAAGMARRRSSTWTRPTLPARATGSPSATRIIGCWRPR